MKTEEVEKENLEEGEVETGLAISNIQDFGNLSAGSDTISNIFTNIQDKKKIFNLNSNVDHLLNDCVGEMIRVQDVLIKRYLKPMKEPVIDEETGEIIKDKEMTMSTVLVDTEGKSYATGSKVFGIQIMQYLQMFATKEGFEPFTIRVVKKAIKGSSNKALGFELV